MNSQATVYVVDDEPAVRDSLRALLESVGFRVETYASAGDFLARWRPRPGGCLLLDVRMPGIDGLELQRHLCTDRVPLPIIMLTGHGDVPMAVGALKSGAVDFVEKPFDDEDLIQRIKAAIVEGIDVATSGAERAAITARLATLTPRERQVLNLLVAGHGVKTIGRRLGTSPNTVRNQRASVLGKMQADSVAELVRMVMIARGAPGQPGPAE